jgi:hypothetical protein
MRKVKTAYKKEQKNKRDTVLGYLREYQKKFKLGNIRFTIVYVRGEKVKDYYAEILMRGNRVRIKFNEDLMEKKPQEIKDTVVHELLHVLLYRLMNKIICIIGDNVSKIDSQRKYEEKLCNLEHEVIGKLLPTLILNTNKKPD